MIYGTPEWIRTTDLLLRRQTLYPAELRARNGSTPIVVSSELSVKLHYRTSAFAMIGFKQIEFFDHTASVRLSANSISSLDCSRL